MEQIAPQIYRWTAPHPEWRSSVEEVVSYVLVNGEALAFVDPLLPSEDDARRAAAPRTARHHPLPHAQRRDALRALLPHGADAHLGARRRQEAAHPPGAARGDPA